MVQDEGDETRSFVANQQGIREVSPGGVEDSKKERQDIESRHLSEPATLGAFAPRKTPRALSRLAHGPITHAPARSVDIVYGCDDG